MTGGCGITVLRTIGSARATKEWKWDPHRQQWSRRDYQAGRWFRPEEITVGSLRELADVLTSLSRDPTAFIVRGALAPWARERVAADPESRVYRLKHRRGNDEASLIEVGRSWLMLDIDNYPLLGGDDLAGDPETVIARAVEELLPEEFQGADYFWMLSASAGFAGGVLKAHVFLWLAEPASNEHIKRVLKQHAPGVDTAPFNAAQPHYIANPVVTNGHDPLPRRMGWRQGFKRAVTLPALRPEAPRPGLSGTGAVARGGGVTGALAALGHGPDRGGPGGDGLDGFHAPLRAAIWHYARECRRHDDRDDEAFKARLREAIRAAPRRPGSDVETPYCQEGYLDSSIAGPFARLAIDPDVQTMRPHHEAPAYTVEEARAAVTDHVKAFIKRAMDRHRRDEQQTDEPPEHAALANDVGVGKSMITREELSPFVEAMGAAGLPHRALWLVPTHKLGNEALAGLTGLGVNAAVWRGREAADPDAAPPEGDAEPTAMCLNLEAVKDAVSILEDVEASVCGSGKPGKPSCPFRDRCGYQRQKAAVAAAADVVVAAHQGLFHRLPELVTNGVGLVVVDESFWQTGLVPHRPIRVATLVEEVQQQPPPLKTDAWWLKEFSLRARIAFGKVADGSFVTKTALREAGLTAGECGEAIDHEWKRKVTDVLKPGMSPDARRKAMLKAAGNNTIPKRVAMWKALRELLAGGDEETGRLEMATLADQDGPYRAALLRSRLDVREEVAGVPILCLDATMPADVVRHFLPRLNVLAEIRAATPHARIHQITGGWGKTSLVPSERATPEENRRRERLVAEVADFARLNSGGDALAVTYQAIEPRLAAEGVRTGHFNAIAGLDEFRDVRSVFVIGRPLPDAGELRALALALTGKAIPPEQPKRETRGVLMADGSGQAATVRTYASPDLEALRTAITDAEVFQALGRGRAVNRTAETPLDMFILADVVLQLPVTTLGPVEIHRALMIAEQR